MVDDDPFRRLRFTCPICLSKKLVAVCARGETTQVADVVMPAHEEADKMEVVYQSTLFRSKEISRYCCGACGYLVSNVPKTSRGEKTLLNWLRQHDMLDV